MDVALGRGADVALGGGKDVALGAGFDVGFGRRVDVALGGGAGVSLGEGAFFTLLFIVSMYSEATFFWNRVSRRVARLLYLDSKRFSGLG